MSAKAEIIECDNCFEWLICLRLDEPILDTEQLFYPNVSVVDADGMYTCPHCSKKFQVPKPATLVEEDSPHRPPLGGNEAA